MCGTRILFPSRFLCCKLPRISRVQFALLPIQSPILFFQWCLLERLDWYPPFLLPFTRRGWNLSRGKLPAVTAAQNFSDDHSKRLVIRSDCEQGVGKQRPVTQAEELQLGKKLMNPESAERTDRSCECELLLSTSRGFRGAPSEDAATRPQATREGVTALCIGFL